MKVYDRIINSETYISLKLSLFQGSQNQQKLSVCKPSTHFYSPQILSLSILILPRQNGQTYAALKTLESLKHDVMGSLGSS